jgi:hypothetical protein
VLSRFTSFDEYARDVPNTFAPFRIVTLAVGEMLLGIVLGAVSEVCDPVVVVVVVAFVVLPFPAVSALILTMPGRFTVTTIGDDVLATKIELPE